MYVTGEVQGLKPASSRLHSRLLSLSVEVKAKIALVWLLRWVGAVLMRVSGAVRSTNQAW
jgi:hypothetical protein